MLIILLCRIGFYSVNNSPFEVLLTIVFAALGVVLHKLGCEPAPLVLGFDSRSVAGGVFPAHDDHLEWRSPPIFAHRPLSLSLLVLALIVTLSVGLHARLKQKQARAQ